MDIAAYLANIPKPSETLLRGVQTAQGLQQVKSNQMVLDKNQAEVDYQNQLAEDIRALGDKPSPAGVASLSAKYPKLASNFKTSFDMLNSEQQQSKIDSASRVYAATLSGRPDVAEQYLMESSEAAKNAGDDKEAKTLSDLASLVKHSPRSAQMIAGVMLSTAMGDKFIETFSGLENSRRSQELQASAVSEAGSKAHKAAVESKYAESNAVVDLEKKGWDIWKLQQDTDIARENSRIALMNATIAKETNSLKRDELQQKIDKAKEARDQLVRDKAENANLFASGLDNSLSTVDRILKSPGLGDVTGAFEGKEFYPNSVAAVAGSAVSPVLGSFTSSADERSNVIADIETLKSQQFINQLKSVRAAAPNGSSGMGNLTEKEGDRLINSLQSLERTQGTEKYRSSLKEIQRLMLKMRESYFNKYGMPQSVPDRPDMVTPKEKPTGDIPLPSTQGFKVIGVEG